MNGDEAKWTMLVLEILLGIIGFGLAGWSAYLMNAIRKNTQGIVDLAGLIARHELEDARTYISKEDFKETVLEMKDTIKRVYDKMDQISQTLTNLNRDK